MTNGCDVCEYNGTPRATFSQVLRRGILSVVIVAAAIAILLGESWVIEHSQVLFTATAQTPRTEHVRVPAAALESDVIPIAVLH
jgi:hypothetical protein